MPNSEDDHHALVLLHRVAYPQGALVFGIVVVFGGQPFADALFERLHLRVGVESVYGDDRVVHDRIVGLEDQLAGRQRDVAHRIALLGVASVDAGHAVDVVVDFDRLAQRVVAAEEYSFERLVDDDHLAVVVDVGLIDETSLDDLDAFDLLDLGQRAAQADVGEAVEPRYHALAATSSTSGNSLTRISRSRFFRSMLRHLL